MTFLKLGNTEIKTVHFHRSKESINAFDLELRTNIASDAFAYGKKKKPDTKYFIGCESDDKIRTLFTEIQQMI